MATQHRRVTRPDLHLPWGLPKTSTQARCSLPKPSSVRRGYRNGCPANCGLICQAGNFVHQAFRRGVPLPDLHNQVLRKT